MFIKDIMDISANFNTIMLQYNKNVRDYNENIRNYLQLVQYSQRNDNNHRRTHPENRTNMRSRNMNTGATRFLNALFPDTTFTNTNTFVRQIFPREREYQDVLVRPTDDEIYNATETIIFDELDESTMNTSCPITLEPFNAGERICRIKHCSHSFKQVAIADWFRRNVRCPVCRYDIRDYNADDFADTSANAERDVEVESEVDSDTDEFNDVIDELIQESENSRARESGARESGARESGARESGARESGARESGARESGARESAERSQSSNSSQRRPQLTSQSRPQSRPSFTQNLTQAIRNFVSNEIQHLPFDINSTASELLYTFDIPLTFDLSRNAF